MFPCRRGRWLRALAATASAGVLLTLSACGGGSDASDADGTASVKFTYEWTCGGDWAVGYVGEQQGYFAQEKLKVGFTRGQGGSATTPLVASGKYDIGSLSAPALVLGMGEELPLKVFGVAAQTSPVAIIADSSVVKPSDLEGRTIAIQTDQFEGAVWDAFVKASGIDLDKVKVVKSTDASDSQFIDGKIDALIVYYPTTSTYALLNQRPGGSSVLQMQKYVPSFGHSLVTNTAYLNRNPDTVRRFSNAWARSVEYAVSHRAAALKLLENKCPELSAGAAKYSLNGYLDSFVSGYADKHGILAFDPEGLKQTEAVLVGAKLMDPVDLGDHYTTDYLPDPAVKP
ncbi:ABC transporter substrate-binding protein [Streptomyces shenzhenensis]|uniref:ABC transporter substrate-binding protein n=1 Tax=Streptomyces shenzhenensis TaxID=943815 RepID=UPI0037F56C4B